MVKSSKCRAENHFLASLLFIGGIYRFVISTKLWISVNVSGLAVALGNVLPTSVCKLTYTCMHAYGMDHFGLRTDCGEMTREKGQRI